MTHHLTLDDITLFKGGHQTRLQGVCLLEAVAWWADEEHGDHPACVSPVLGAFGRSLNDVLPDGKRQQLVPCIPLMVGTSHDGRDETRSYIALDWLIRTWTPAWLDLAGLGTHATALRDLTPITDLGTAQQAAPPVRAAAAAGDAARDAADAAGAAAWDAAGAAAGDAAWDAAWDAAGAAAWDAAGDAAWDAAGAAAWDAARAALAPTVAMLQDSAISLYDRMISPAADHD